MILPTDLYKTEDGKPVKVKFNRSLYGLKQAGYVWNKKFAQDLIDIGFKQTKHDKCVFIYSDEERNIKIYCVIFVDDTIITGNSLSEIHRLGISWAPKYFAWHEKILSLDT